MVQAVNTDLSKGKIWKGTWLLYCKKVIFSLSVCFGCCYKVWLVKTCYQLSKLVLQLRLRQMWFVLSAPSLSVENTEICIQMKHETYLSQTDNIEDAFFFTGYKERFWFLVWAVKTEWSSIKQQKQPTFFRQSHFTSHYHILDLHRVQICHPHMQCTKVQAKSAAKVKYELEMVSFILV